MTFVRRTRQYIESGTNNVICHVCGDQIKGSKALRRWDNLIVCPSCWEPEHPQDNPRVPRTEYSRVDWDRPEPDPYYLDTNEAAGKL